MNSEIERPESSSFDDVGSSNDLCIRPNDIASPHYQTTCTLQSLNRLGDLCRIPAEVMKDSQMPEPTESPENHRPGFFCVYEIYFKGCGLTSPLPEDFVRYLSALEIALPQLTPNLLRTIMGIITVAEEARYVIGVPELIELLSVRSSSKKLSSHRPFRLLNSPKGKLSGTLWNSFTLDRFVEANHKLRMSPPGHLLQLPLPPPLPQGTSARVIAARRKTLSKSIVEACETNKSFLQSAVDKKEYSRTLLVDNGSAEGAKSAGAYRPIPHREGHSGQNRETDQPGVAPPPKEIRREPELITLLGHRHHPALWALVLQSPYLLCLDPEVKRPIRVQTPGEKKLRSEMPELRLFLFLRPSRSRANGELNDMIEYYERLLLDREKEVMTWKDKSSSLEFDLRASDPVELEASIVPTTIPEAVTTPPEIPPSTNSETVVIEDDDGSDSKVPSEQPTTGEPGETETAVADLVDPESAQPELEKTKEPPPSVPLIPEVHCFCPAMALSPPVFSFLKPAAPSPRKTKRRRTILWIRSLTSIAAYAMKGNVWASRGKRSRPELPILKGSEDCDDDEEDSNPWKRVNNEPDVNVKNEASTSNPEPAIKEPVPEPLP
ncbi:hypothetical protein AXX17_AT5G29750 [Arabidopsis thaliana]|uniref:Uncharacterized protein n=1 Tax=Arabidopsis thaliana TaxID=3702 RepID=A0A178UMK4_ARATH|nr:hypothetical protein AXX17_AT5G29750 [Arabidopsis thaliana]